MPEVFRRQQFVVAGAPTKSAVLDLPDGVDIFKVRIDRPTTGRPVPWDRHQHIAVQIFLSLDGGTTWESLTAYTTHGGSHVVNGVEEAQNVHVCQIDPRAKAYRATGRKVMVSFASLHGPPPVLTVDVEAI